MKRLKKKFSDDVVNYILSPSLENQRRLFHPIQLINKAHVLMLHEQGIIKKRDCTKILSALKEIDEEGENFKLDPYLEDIYMNVERQVVERIGEDIGGKMHTGRSRNDLYSCAYRMVVRDKLLRIMIDLNKIRESLLNRASDHSGTLMPGFTHTQPAQPTTLGHYLLAIADSIGEDLERIKNAYKRTNLNPLGAAAFAGTGFPINRSRTTELLGFDEVIENSLKAVSDFSYFLEALSSLAILMGNISRFMGDLIMWSTPAFGMLELDDSFAGTSSIMPQKKNPFTAEIIRSAAGEVNGSLVKALSIVKGLPIGFNFDLLCLGDWCLEAFDVVHSNMCVLDGIISTLIVHKDAMGKRAMDGFSISTELVDMLVREKRISFRTAHRIIAGAVGMAREKGQDHLTADAINEAAQKIIGQSIGLEKGKMLASPSQILRARKSKGGGSPKEVQKMIKNREVSIRKEDLWIKQKIERIKEGRGKLNNLIMKEYLNFRLRGLERGGCDMSYTKDLAGYLGDLKYKDLPKEVIEQAKLLTLHTVGVALASYPTGQAKRAIALAKSWGSGQKESTLFGDGTKVSSVNAAFANGTMADLLDWEDCSWTGHPSANAIPGALALAEAIKASGREYILAVVGGWEVYQRIAMAVQPSDDWGFLRKGWGLTSWEIYAAAMPAAKLLKLSKEKINQVIGIAGAMTPIVNAKVHRTLSDFYHYQHGFTCRDGVASALVAESGIETLYDFLDGEDGYWCTISDQCDWDWYNKRLGKDFTIMETLFKHWPANMWIQTPLDTLDALVKRDSIEVDEIAEILISPQFEYRMGYKPEGYKSNTEAEFSIPYCLAVYLLDPEPGPDWYDKERLKAPKVLELAKKVKGTGPTQGLHASFKMMREGSFPEVTIKVTLKDGREFTNSIRFPKGHPKNRMTTDEFKDRFRRTASFALKAKKIEEAIEKILNLDEVDDISTIGQVLHG